MRKQRLQKEELDQIGRKLLEKARISNEEIEEIVAAPQLFDAVKLRIKTGEPKSKSFSGNWRNSSLWTWQKIFAASAAAALFVFGAIGFVFIGKSLQMDEQAALVPEIQTESEAVAPIFEDFSETRQAENPEIKLRITAKKNFVKKESVRKPKPERKTPAVKRPGQSEMELLRDFYALNYVGNPNETGEALRIVRAEISPSALFALGVNVPIENTKEKIKTDLLVGSDGVARAIRFVK